MNSNFKVALELLNRYSVRFLLFISFFGFFFSPSLSSMLTHVHPLPPSTDTPLRRHPPVTACPRTNGPHPEQRCRPILPAIRVDQARTHERCVRVVRQGGRMAHRQPDTSWRDPWAGGQPKQGVLLRYNNDSPHELTGLLLSKFRFSSRRRRIIEMSCSLVPSRRARRYSRRIGRFC